MSDPVPFSSDFAAHSQTPISRRRTLALLGGSIAALLQSACEQSPDVAEAPDAEGVRPPQTEPAEASVPDLAEVVRTDSPEFLPFEGIEIEFWPQGLNPRTQTALQVELAKFKDLTGISVRERYVTLVRFGSCLGVSPDPKCPESSLLFPDIYQGGSLSVPEYVRRGEVLEIDEYVTDWGDWADFYPLVRKDVEFDGRTYGVPVRTRHRGSIVIRPSLFESSGLPPEPPGSWDELNEIAPKLVRRDGEVIERAGINLQHHAQVYEDWLIQAGGQTFNDELSWPMNNSPEGVAALSQHVRPGLFDHTMPKEGMPGLPNLHPFCTGNVAIQMLWPGNLGNCETNAADVFDDSEIGAPLEGPKRRGMHIYVDKFMISSRSHQPDAAFEAIKFLSSPARNYEIYIVDDRAMPCRAAIENFELYSKEPWRAFASNIKHSQVRQIRPWHFDIQPAMSRWVEKAGLGELSVTETLAGMDEEIREIISGS